MALIDRKRVRRAFSQQAWRYDDVAVVQKRVVSRILSQVPKRVGGEQPKRILDIGSGTGMLLKATRIMWPESFAVGIDLAPGMAHVARLRLSQQGRTHFVAGDAERLPFAAVTFDLVLSTSTFQWFESLDNVFSEVFRVLTPGGRFHFALFGERTLYELQESYRYSVAGLSDGMAIKHLQRFFTREEVSAALSGCGFIETQVEYGLEIEQHGDVKDLLRSLSQIGAGNAVSGTPRGLFGRRAMQRMVDYYQKEFGQDGFIPATYGVIYGTGQKW